MKRQKLMMVGLSVLAAALCTTPVLVSAQIAAPVATTVPGVAADIPFELFRGNRIVLSGRINGHQTEMLLDSGAGLTTLDRDFARSIGLKQGEKITAQGVGGEQEAELVRGVTIDAGNLNLRDATVVVIDLDQIEKGIGRPVPVILGRELFMNNVVAIDFQRQVLSLAPGADFAAPAGATEIKLTRDGSLHYLPLSIDGLPPVEAALDLGNGGALSLSKEYHEATPRIAALPFAVGMAGGVGGVHEIKRTTIGKVDIGGFSLSGVPADLGALADGPYAGRANAGIQLFVPFQVTLDLGRDRMWLKRASGTPVFTKDRAGMFMLLEGDHFNVMHVAPGSPADRAGLKKGDQLTSINGQRIGQGFYSSAMSNWSREAPGTAVELTRRDGTKVVLTLADYY